MTFQANHLATMFFKALQYGYETFQNFKPALQNYVTKNFELSANH